MKKDNEKPDQDMSSFNEFINGIHRTGSQPKLSQHDKKQILQDVLPRTSLFFRFLPAYAPLAVVLVVIGIGFIRSSQPGDILYDIKRTGEDARSIVQPSYDVELIQKRENEIQSLESQQAPSEKIERAKTEKIEIEKRVEERLKIGTSTTEELSNAEVENGPKPPLPQTNPAVQDPPKSPEELKKERQKAAEDCKNALDAKKRAGIKVNSDEYKSCDALKGEDD